MYDNDADREKNLLSQKILELESMLYDKQQDLLRHKEALKNRELEIKKLHTQLSNYDKERDYHQRHLVSYIADLQETILQIRNSLSWKVTGPLRIIAHFFGIGKAISKNVNNADSQNSNHNNINPLIEKLISFTGFDLSFQKKTALPQRTAEVDIIVCVHNALIDVGICLSSIIRYTTPPYRLILVNDGSDNDTTAFLENFASAQGALYLYNPNAQGYTKAANKGLKASDKEFVVLLNSDTRISQPDWLDRMVFCIQQDAKTGIVGPLSNTASWQSVPEIFEGNDWAENLLPEDLELSTFTRYLGQNAFSIYPEIPFLNGFCLLIRRELIKAIGHFDEESFPRGYGEENDFCLRASEKGWKLRVAGDVFVYHAQSKSYSHENRKLLSENAGIALARKHDQKQIEAGVLKCRNSLLLNGLRSRIKQYPKLIRCASTVRKAFAGKKILFVLPVIDLGGGANVVIQEIQAMREMNVDCFIANHSDNQVIFCKSYPDLEIPMVFYDRPSKLASHFHYFDAVVGTTYSSMFLIDQSLLFAEKSIITGYYIQDYEPHFFKEGSLEWRRAFESYNLIKGTKCFTKTQWNQDEVKNATGIEPKLVGPSYNSNLFFPSKEKHFEKTIHVVAMVRPSTPRRGPDITLQVLKMIKRTYKDEISVFTFGCSEKEELIKKYKKEFSFNHLGVLGPEQLSALFSNSHLFIDMSTYQAMGLTGMEAMACGNVVMLPESGGASSFIVHAKNGFLIDTSSMESCLKNVGFLMGNRQRFFEIASTAISDISAYSPIFAATNMLTCLFDKTDS
jgi:GT2 family glycosyltransferase